MDDDLRFRLALLQAGHPTYVVHVRMRAGDGLQLEPMLVERLNDGDHPGGTGLGLYVSKSLIEAHGGRIWAYNNTDEQGATFCFTLPLRSMI